MRRANPRLRWLWGVGALAVLAVAAPHLAPAQTPGSAPLTARLILKDPPPGVTYDATSPATPITIVLQIENTSGVPIITTDGFSKTEFWRRLVFDLGGNLITNTDEAGVHTYTPVSFCFSRRGVLLRPTAAAVTPVELLAGPPDPPFVLEYTIDDARRFYDLSRPGRYLVDATIPLQTFAADSTAIISDCDQFAGRTVVRVDAVSGREDFTVLSNKLEFFIQSDGVPPTTVATVSPSPTNGWNRTDVTVTLTATDNPGGSGVRDVVFSVNGQPARTVSGNVATVPVTAEGTTTVTYFAHDQTGNTESPKTLTLRLDKTPPELTARCAPSGGGLVVGGRDAGGSGVAQANKTTSTPVRRGEFKSQDAFSIRDVAGHSLDAVFAVKSEGGENRFSLLTLAYDSAAATAVEANTMKCEAGLERGTLKEFEQKLELSGQGLEVRAKFDAKKNQTEIRVKRNGVEQRSTRQGLVFLLLTTRRGQPLGFEL